MKIGTKYFYLLRVCREIDEAHLCGLLCDKAHIHWNEAPEKPPKKREEPLSLPLPFDVETGETICEK